MQALNYRYHQCLKIALWLYGILLSLSWKPSPPSFEQQLRQLKAKNDLSGWIYLQIQWVAKAPGQRSALLKNAVDHAWRKPSSNEEIQAWQDLLTNQGYALLLSGDIVRSTESYTAAFEWARQHAELADESLLLDNILKPLGNNYTRLGDYEQALFIHHKALAVAQSLDESDALAGTYSNLANTASNMGRPAEALQYCRGGLSIVKRSSALHGLLLSEQADALLQLNQKTEARRWILESIKILEAVRTPEARSWLLTAYQQAGDIHASTPGQALTWYQKALKLEQQMQTVHQRQKAKLFQRIGDLYGRTGQSAKASLWLGQCLSVLIPGKALDSVRSADLYGENTLVDLYYTAAGLAARQGQYEKAIYRYKLSFSAENVLRREMITGTSRERSVSDSHQRYETAIHTAWEAWGSTHLPMYQQAILDLMEGSKARLLLDEVQQQQQLALKANAGDSVAQRIRLLEQALIYYKKESMQHPGSTDSVSKALTAREKQTEWELAQLRKKISTPQNTPPPINGPRPYPSQLIRSFFAGEEALYVVERDQKGIRFADRQALSHGWQDSIRAFTNTWFTSGPANMINRPGQYYREAYMLYRRLFGPHPLQTAREYVLIPDGALNMLPVEALVTVPACPPSPADWLFVIRQASISYAWSIRTLQEQMSATGNSKGFSGFFLSDAHQLPLLNNVAAEQKGIASAVTDGNYYQDKNATVASFRQALQSAAVVHISSHAFSSKDTGQAPHIALYDQPFYLFELKDLHQHPSLVVLSACRTGDGRMVRGEGIQSLARAFTAEGTSAVIAGWWNVNDATAAQLMERFYRKWVPEDKKGIAAALRQSKLDWLYDPKVPYQYKLPYYWSALNYAGNPQPLKDPFREKTHPYIWWVIAVLAIAALLVAALRLRR